MQFNEWKSWVFDHEVIESAFHIEDGEPWYIRDEEEWDDKLPKRVLVAYLAQLFSDSVDQLREYSDDQVGVGLRFIVSSDLSCHMQALVDSNVPCCEAATAVASMINLFENVLMPRSYGFSVLSQAASLWWSYNALLGEQIRSDRRELVGSIGAVMWWLLCKDHGAQENNVLCQSCALAGLERWVVQEPGLCTSIIREYIQLKKAATARLQELAVATLAQG